MNDNRWTKIITDLCPYNYKRSKKRPDTRWRDEIEKKCWKNMAKNSSRQAVMGGIWERPMFSSGLTRADDDDYDDDVHYQLR